MSNKDKNKNAVIRGLLLMALIDTDALLRVYLSPYRQSGPNSSTRGQAEAVIKVNSAVITFVKETYPDE